MYKIWYLGQGSSYRRKIIAKDFHSAERAYVKLEGKVPFGYMFMRPSEFTIVLEHLEI
jgi:hypothetical protein